LQKAPFIRSHSKIKIQTLKEKYVQFNENNEKMGQVKTWLFAFVTEKAPNPN
jgi:hypothetical protein